MTLAELQKQRDEKRAIGDVAYADLLQQKMDAQTAANANPAYNVPGIGNGMYTSQVQKDASDRQLSSPSYTYSGAQDEANKRLESMRQSQIGSVNNSYDDLAKQAYVTKMQSEGSLPAVLAATGKTGGMAETTAASPTVAYQNALAGYGKSKTEAINKINQATDEQALQIAVDFADKIMNQQNVDRSYNYQAGRDAIGDQRYTDETAYNRSWNEDDRNYTRAWNADDRTYNRSWNEDERNYSRNNYADETAYTRAAAEAQASGDFSVMKAFGWTDEDVSRANYNLQAANAQKAATASSKTSKATNSPSYSNILKNAKAMAAEGNTEGAEAYLNNMVDSGFITEDEAATIYLVDVTPTSQSSKSGPTTYEDFVQATQDSSIYTQAEFNRRKAANSGGTANYANYQDYLNAMYKKYQ